MKTNIIFLCLLLSGIASGQYFTPRYIHSFYSTRLVDVVDLDGDGSNDILQSSFTDFFIDQVLDTVSRRSSLKSRFGGENVPVFDYKIKRTEIADFTGDGLNDIVANDGQSSLFLYIQQPDHTFQKMSIYTDRPGVVTPHSGDIDGDADRDVVIFLDGHVLLFINNGLGAFSVVDHDGHFNDRDVVLTDLDKNGISEIAVYHKYSTSEARLKFFAFNAGDQVLEDMSRYARFSRGSDLGNELPKLAFYDLDSDGDMDITSSWGNLQRVYESINDGDFNFIRTAYDVRHTQRHLFVDDIDTDGTPEYITISTDSIVIYKRIADQYSVWITHPNQYTHQFARYIDYDQDGDKDIVGHSYIRNDDEWSAYEEIQLVGGTLDYGLRDIDANGLSDVFMALNGSLSVAYQQQPWDFTVFTDSPQRFDVPRTLVPAQFDDDEFLEVIGGHQNDSVYLYDAIDSAHYDIRFLFRTSQDNLLNLKVHDLDLDGDPDILHTSKSLDINLEWFENKGNSEFVNHVLFSKKWWINESIILDFDRDGDPDILTAFYLNNSGLPRNTGQIRWFRNNGSGSFSDTILYSEYNAEFRQLFIHDIDQDGIVEFFISGYFQNQLQSKILVRNPEGNYTAVIVDVPEHTQGSLRSNGIEYFFFIRNQQVHYYTLDKFYQQEVYPIPLINVEAGQIHVLDFDGDSDQDLFIDANVHENAPNLSGEFLVLENVSIDSVGIVEVGVFLDTNQNGVQDAGESAFGDYSLKLSPLNLTYLKLNGNTIIQLPIGSYKATLTDIDFSQWNITTGTQEELFQIQSNALHQSISFGLYPKILIRSIDVDITNTLPICHRAIRYFINLKNTGTIPLDTVNTTFQYHTDQTYLDAFPIPVLQTPGLVTHQYTTWPVNKSYQQYVRLRMPDEFHTWLYYVNVADVNVISSGEILYATSDTNTVVQQCAIDPNDITVSPRRGPPGYILPESTPLEYTIRFQNTGNSTAENVRIENQLPVQVKLDSFKLVSTSHPEVMNARLDLNTNKFTADFIGIHLIDSTTSFDESQGFIKYMVYTRDNLMPGIKINNSAKIFFDLNQPVATNTEFNTVTTCDELNGISVLIDTVSVPWRYQVTISNPILDSIQWRVDGDLVSDSSTVFIPYAPGLKQIHVMASSALCVLDSTFVLGTTANHFISSSAQLSVYPSPAQDRIWLYTPDQQLTFLNVTIYNSFGTVMHNSKPLNGHEVNVLDLPSGMYFISVTLKDGNRMSASFVKK